MIWNKSYLHCGYNTNEKIAAMKFKKNYAIAKRSMKKKKKQERVPYQLVTATEGSSSDLVFSWNGKKVLRKQQAIEIRWDAELFQTSFSNRPFPSYRKRLFQSEV